MNKELIKNKPLGKDETAKVKTILETLEKDPRAYDFLVPVDYIGIFFTLQTLFPYLLYFFYSSIYFYPLTKNN